MREILFRGKTEKGQWVYGSLITIDNKTFIVNEEYSSYVSELLTKDSFIHDYVDNIQQIIPETVAQYTGLKDKNGTKIFEGDKLSAPRKSDWDYKNYIEYEVFYHDNDQCEYNIGFQMNRLHFKGSICGTSDFRKFKPKTVKDMIITGNIHDKN